MLQKLAHDIVNDVAIFKTLNKSTPYSGRYGLEVKHFTNLENAIAYFQSAQRHAFLCEGVL